MSIKMAVSCQMGSIHFLYFDTREQADVELALIAPKLGVAYRFKNDRDDVHTINSPSGPLVVVLDKVEVVRLVDTEVWERLGAEDEEKSRRSLAKDEAAKEAAKRALG